MDSKRIYRILSVLFFILTVFFFVLFLKENMVKGSLSDEYVTEAVINIQAQGVDITKEIISYEIPEKDIYSFVMTDVETHNSEITDVICQYAFENETSTSKFETPVGTVVSVYKKDSDNEIGRIIFNNSEFSFEFMKSGINISGTENPFLNERQDLITTDVYNLVDKVCKNLTNSSKMNYRVSGCSGDNEFFVVTAVQTVKKHDISDAFMNFAFENNKLVSVSGNWIIDEPNAKYSNTLVDGVNALYSLDLREISKIERQRIVYDIKNADSDRYYLIPVWEICYVDKNGERKTYFADAI